MSHRAWAAPFAHVLATLAIQPDVDVGPPPQLHRSNWHNHCG
jgi:hypothetical protein